LVVIITHTDLDGIASAALVWRGVGEPEKIFFIQPQQLGKVLGKVPGGSDVYITDLGINQGTLNDVVRNAGRIIGSGGRIRWFDHHMWDGSWIDKLRGLGAEIYVDTSTCAAGVVMEHLPLSDRGAKELVSATCSIDLWMFNDWRGNFLARYVGYRDDSGWRAETVRLLKDFMGKVGNDIVNKVSEVVDSELKTYSRVVEEASINEINGLRLAYYFKNSNEHLTSFIGNLMLSRFNADIALICKYRSVSLRSRGFNVREVAKSLGGGGHPRAAGASVSPPLWRLLAALVGYRRPLLSWCVGKVSDAITRSMR